MRFKPIIRNTYNNSECCPFIITVGLMGSKAVKAFLTFFGVSSVNISTRNVMASENSDTNRFWTTLYNTEVNLQPASSH